jgi:hypothetical protein
MLRIVGLVRTDISEERIAFIFRVTIGELGTTLVATDVLCEEILFEKGSLRIGYTIGVRGGGGFKQLVWLMCMGFGWNIKWP